jgi:hypothetical protein
MSRIVFVVAVAGLLAGCAGQGIEQVTPAKEQLACADVGIGPDTPAFGQCVVDLDHALWVEQDAAGR